MNVVERIDALRKIMDREKISAWIIPSEDPHQSEYVAERWRGRAFITGFTGSAGTAVFLKDKAGLWTDGRYFLQAEKQLENSGITLFKMGMPGTPTVNEWLNENLKKGDVISFEPELFSESYVRGMKKDFIKASIEIKPQKDILNEIWKERPAMPENKAFLLKDEFAGISRKTKIENVRETFKKDSIDTLFLSSLDDIAWLYNLRGSDIECNPVVISYAAVDKDNAFFFVDKAKFDVSEIKSLENDGIAVKDYGNVWDYLKSLKKKTVSINPAKNSHAVFDAVPDSAALVEEASVTTAMKAQKNCAEIDGMRNAHLKDGVAMAKFLFWLEKSVPLGTVTEISAAKQLEEFRAEGKDYLYPSFETISGFGEHGAIIHYAPTPESDVTLNDGVYLVDSGGQYLDGTTDITRTVALGDVSDEAKIDFTLVLKGHIDLAMVMFPKGMTGAHLDILARRALWDELKNYNHGTGHGVGACLNVHEGPQTISPRYNGVKLEEGMITSNEPGYYRAGEYGIRIENLVLTVKAGEGEYGEFLSFETLTLCPIDIDMIVAQMLTEDQKEWLNSYHQNVYEQISPFLDDAEKSWLKWETRRI